MKSLICDSAGAKSSSVNKHPSKGKTPDEVRPDTILHPCNLAVHSTKYLGNQFLPYSFAEISENTVFASITVTYI